MDITAEREGNKINKNALTCPEMQRKVFIQLKIKKNPCIFQEENTILQKKS